MSLSKTERRALTYLLKRLQEPRLGCAAPLLIGDEQEILPPNYEGVSRSYVDCWLVGSLAALLNGNAKLAEELVYRAAYAGRDPMGR